jgi:hypothetical protein
MKRLLATIGTVSLLTASAAFAQDWDSDAFQQSYSQIEQSVATEFDQLGVDLPVESLSMAELGSIELVLNDTELSDDEKREQIETIVTETGDTNR